MNYDTESEMNCTFCNDKLSDPTHQWQGDLIIAEFECKECLTKFSLEIDPLTDNKRLIHYEFIFDKFKLNFELDGPLFTLYSYQKTGVASKISHILDLNTLPNITPQNVKDKILTLLTFL